MPRIVKLWDGSDPGATPGRVFTASINLEAIVKFGEFLDYIAIGVKGAVSTAAVVIETFAAVVAEYSLNFGELTRIQGNLRDLLAISLAVYSDLPMLWENTDNSGNDFIGGFRLPIRAKMDDNKPVTHSMTYATQTNIGTETVALTGYFEDKALPEKPIHAVVIAHSTAGSAGYEELNFRLPPIGFLKHLIVMQTNGFSDGNIDISVQRVRIKKDGEVVAQFNSLADAVQWRGRSVGVLDPMDDLLRNYDIYNCGREGFDLKSGIFTLAVDVQDVSDAIRIIPVIELS